ncbi:4a-hydroxytetrahydrobiopterin dehydratase [Alicyclobacillus acidiphilus]|uniref:4a-hydroxytetrahydrobiopterin dehydratase n=1 Tax=Alicyclobacillus acidiphilus TaxID=182455 RepID=UPI000829978D|nr:4a-hydroxytetrahydrobiopterin dehydratase [Alicyclobacillus acidiphilus]
MDRLSEEEIASKLTSLPTWTKNGKMLEKRYRFGSFFDAIQFVNRVAELAEHMNHHPFISIDYKVVSIRLTSWHAGGLTVLDFDQAAMLDQIYDSDGVH